MNRVFSKLSYMELFAYERMSVNEISHKMVVRKQGKKFSTGLDVKTHIRRLYVYAN